MINRQIALFVQKQKVGDVDKIKEERDEWKAIAEEQARKIRMYENRLKKVVKERDKWKRAT